MALLIYFDINCQHIKIHIHKLLKIQAGFPFDDEGAKRRGLSAKWALGRPVYCIYRDPIETAKGSRLGSEVTNFLETPISNRYRPLVPTVC